jgi:homoserine dehydrogenase
VREACARGGHGRDRVRVAVLGAGTVGREVIRAFLDAPDRLAVDGGPRLVLAGVAVRDVDRAARDGIPPELLTDVPARLVASPDIDVVVELIGGDEPARTLVAAALEARKPVVTANKHVIAAHGPSLERTARESGAALRFEAAVGGGIPVLRPLAGDLAANCVTRIRGIVNGTTNYILTAMARDGLAYDAVLADAQAAGYAEADPSGDVEGTDAANKLAILARLAFRRWVDPAAIVRRPPSLRGDAAPGIAGVSAVDIAGAISLGLAMKLVADARVSTSVDDATGVRASVLPTAVPLADPVARTDGVTNRIEVDAEPVGRIAFSGPGAGGRATASAVLGDLLAIARGEASTWAALAPAVVMDRPSPPSFDRADAGWFFVVASREARQHVEDGTFGEDVRTTTVGDATAVQATGIGLADLRSRLLAHTSDDVDIALYPVERSTHEAGTAA